MENKMKIDTDEDKILREQATIITDNTLKMIDEEDAMIINTNKKVEENEKKIHFLYFTNPGRTNLLEMSLKSIERVKHKCMGTVFIYTNHFPSKELSTLEEDVKSYNLDLDIKIINRRYFQGYYGGLGIKDFNPEMRVYLEINEEIGKDDWICQINTDILMLSNSIFK